MPRIEIQEEGTVIKKKKKNTVISFNDKKMRSRE